MKLSEIKKSVTVALMTAIASESDKPRREMTGFNSWLTCNLTQDIEKQCQIVGTYLGERFMLDCMKDAQSCLEDPKKFDSMMKKFEEIGPRFSEEIEED